MDRKAMTGAATGRVRADLIIGSARIPVGLIDLSGDGAAIDLPGAVSDFAGSSLHVHGVGRVPIEGHRALAGQRYLLRFGVSSAKLRRKLEHFLKSYDDDLVGPAIAYLTSAPQ